MKKGLFLGLFLGLMGYSTISQAWGFNQNIILEDKTHDTVKEFNGSIERSAAHLAEAINTFSEKGIASLPYNVDPSVWYHLRHLIAFAAIMALGWACAFLGLLSLRKLILFPYTLQTAGQITATSLWIIIQLIGGVTLISLANILARCIIG